MVRILNLKKAQIAATLTWIVAFVIIFFIMLLFFSATAFLSGKKFLSRERDIIEFDEGQDLESLHSQRTLIRIFNTPVDERKTIKDLIFEWQLSKDESVKRKIEEGVEDILVNDEYIGYYFFKVYDLNEPAKDYISIGRVYLGYSKDFFELTLFLNEHKINVGLYVDKKEIKRDVERRKKDTIVIHYTATNTSEDAIRRIRDDGLSVHYVLDKDGTIFECEIDERGKIKKCITREDVLEVEGKWEDRIAYHAGCYDPWKKEQRTPCKGEKPEPGEECCIDVNARSIGIELVNLGDVCEFVGDKCKNRQEVGGVIWEEFSEEQMESLTSLVADIASRYNISIDRDHIIGHDEVAPGYKTDPGPAFPWGEFIEDLKLKEI